MMREKLRQGFRRGASALVAALLAAVLVLPCLAAEEETVLRVAFPQMEGFTSLTEDGERKGVVVDFLNEIAKYTGWRYEYVPTTGEDLLSDFFEGKFDLVGGTFYAEGFEEYFAYPIYHCGYTKSALLARKDDESIRSYDTRTLNGKVIGVYDRAKENIRRLEEYLKINGLDCTLKYYSYEEQSKEGNLYRFLDNGEVDLLLGGSADMEEDYYVAASFDSQAHYIVTTPDNQVLLDGLNMALDKIYDADPNFAVNRYATNFPSLSVKHSELNSQELAYIQGREAVTVAVPSDWHPMICLENGDAHQGIVDDVLAKIGEYTGLRFTYVLCDDYAQAVDKVCRGEAEVLGFFIGGEDAAAQAGLALTASYEEMTAILVRSKTSSYPDDGLVGAALSGCALPVHIMADETRQYTSDTQALKDVNRGRLDFLYGLSTHLEYIIQRENLSNVVQVGLVNDSVDVSFAVPRPAQSPLLTILNKAVNQLSQEERATIRSRNIVSIGRVNMSLSSIIYANPALALAVVSSFLILLLSVVALVFHSRLRAVAVRAELERAEAGNRAKSAFLSRMSHEIRTPMNAIVGFADLAEKQQGLPGETKQALEKIKASSHYLLELINDILDMSRIENGKMEIASETFSMTALISEVEDMMTEESSRRRLDFRLVKLVREDVLVGDAVRLRQVILNLLSNAFKFTPAGGVVQLSVEEKDPPGPDTAAFSFQVSDNGIGIPEKDQQRIFNSFEQVGTNITKSQGTGLGLPICESIVRLMGGELKLRSKVGKGTSFRFTLVFPKGRAEDLPGIEGGTLPEGLLFRGKTLLVAEDNELNAEIAISLLERQGAKTVRATDGKAALELFSRSRPGEYQGILMDVLMPEMDGLAATRAIRALPREDAGTVPIIAMTANAFQEDEAAAMAAGMTGFLKKPMDVSQLYAALYSAMGAGEEEG